MRVRSITILAIIFLLFSTPVFGQMVGIEKMMRGMNISNASEMMQFVKNVREQRGMHGLGFINSEENIFGKFVTFSIDNKTGNVLNYSVMGTKLFDISIDNFNFRSTENIGTTTLVSGTNGSRIVITDSPAAILTIIATKPIIVTFTLASGVSAESLGSENINNLIKITSGNIVGEIISRNITISGNKVTVKTSSSGIVVFRVSPVNMPMFDNMHERIAQKIADNRMGTEISINSNTVSTANFTEVQATVAIKNTSISLKVSSTSPSGRVISVNLDNSSLVVGNNEKLVIRYDGQDLQCSNDSNVVLNGTDKPACWISPIQNGVRAQVLIYIPHFSEHDIEIAVEPTGTETLETNVTSEIISADIPTPTPTPKSPGFEILVAIALLGSAYLIVRRIN